MTQIVVPTLGESVTEATVARWLKKEGESVSADEPVVELETDKVTLEVNAPQAGIVSKIVAPEGSNVKVGALLGELGAANDAKPKPATVKAEPPAKEEKKEDKKPEAAAKPAAAQEAKPQSKPEQAAQSGPAVRKVAADNSVDTSKVSGTGKDGRVTKGDVLEFADKK